MSQVFKALGHPVRRRIVEMLRERPMTSGDIAAVFEDMTWPTVTGHLNALKDAGRVSAERDGASVRYRLRLSAVEEAVGFLLGLVGKTEPETDTEEAKDGKSA
jgi:DNA-binding transcriptional ArsR family regulator